MRNASTARWQLPTSSSVRLKVSPRSKKSKSTFTYQMPVSRTGSEFSSKNCERFNLTKQNGMRQTFDAVTSSCTRKSRHRPHYCGKNQIWYCFQLHFNEHSQKFVFENCVKVSFFVHKKKRSVRFGCATPRTKRRNLRWRPWLDKSRKQVESSPENFVPAAKYITFTRHCDGLKLAYWEPLLRMFCTSSAGGYTH